LLRSAKGSGDSGAIYGTISEAYPDLTIEEPEIESIVKRIYEEGL